MAFPTIQLFAHLKRVPYALLAVGILVFSAVGANALGDINGMVMMFLFAILGFIMEKYHYAIAPMVLGLVLGPIIEPAFRRALMMQEYDLIGIVTRPVTGMLLIVSILMILVPILLRMRKSDSK
jgi:putative tricarboxylic transport membrane protein